MIDISDKINSPLLNDKQKAFASNYFNKFNLINEIIDKVSAKYTVKRGCGYGNYSPKVMFVVNYNYTNDVIIELIKDFYNKNNLNFYSIYLTSIDKFEIKKLDLKILDKEIKTLSPKRIIILGDDIKYPNSINLSKEDLDYLIKCLSSELNINDEKYIQVKNKFIECMQFAFYG